MNAILIDLDGTLCNVSHRTHFVHETPPNWPAFFDALVDDAINPAVATLVDMARESGIAVIYVSGRPETHRIQTEAWLDRHNVASHVALLMRAAGDYRPDDVVKKELYTDWIIGTYHVPFTVDDRTSVVAMWRALGLTCFQVVEGNF